MADSKKKIIVVKIGSSTLVDTEGRVDMGYFAQLATQIADLRSKGWSPIIVSSGAIACSLVDIPTDITSFAMTSIFICLLVGQKMSTEVAVAVVVAVLGVLVCKLVGLSGMAIFIGAVLGVVAGTVFGAVREK